MLIHNSEVGGPQKPPISISREKDGMEERVSGFREILQRMVRVEIDHLP